MDFGGYLDSLGLGFEPFLEEILASKLSRKCVCHVSFPLHSVVLQMLSIFILVSSRDIFLTGLGILGQGVDYFLFPRPIAMCHASSY